MTQDQLDKGRTDRKLAGCEPMADDRFLGLSRAVPLFPISHSSASRLQLTSPLLGRASWK